ncbi:hypothetical protein Tco_0008051 [Tanacetum coccineum]
MMVHNQEEMGAGSAIPTDPHHTPHFISSSPQPQKTQKPRRPKKKDTQVPRFSVPSDNIVDEAVYKQLDDSLVRAATTASSLEAKQDSGNIIKTRSKATPNEASSQGTTSGGGPRCQKTIRDTIAQTRFENVSKLSNDLLLARGNTLRSGEDSLKLNKLMELCINLQQRVLDLEITNTTQANEIVSLKRRVKKLEKKDRSRTHKLKRLYKVGLSARVESSGDEEDLLFVAEQSDNVVEKVVDAAQTITTEEITLADLKSTNPKAKGIVFREPSESTTTTTPIPSKIQDKGKGKMVEPEPMKKLLKKDQLKLHEEIALKLQAEIDEEERLIREKSQQIEKANIAWDDVQAKVEADYQLAQRLQAQEQEELTDEEKARLFVQFLEQRRKHFAAKRAEEKRNRPPTRAQQRNIMCTYLKNMEGWKPKSLKNKSFANIQELFEKAMKRVNTFVDYRTELVEESSKKAETELEENLKKAEAEVMEGSSKRAGEELEQESIKKQKVDEDKETTELQSLIEVIPDEEEVAIDVVPLATKPPTIVDWKIHKEGKKSYYQIIRADGKSQMYRVFSQMLKSFSGEDLEDLYRTNMLNKKLQVDYLNEMAYQLLSLRINEVFGSILLGRIVRIKRLLDDLRVTAAQVCVTAAKLNTVSVKLVLLVKIEENILSSYCWDLKEFKDSSYRSVEVKTAQS